MSIEIRDETGTERLRGDLLIGGSAGEVATVQADGTIAPGLGGSSTVTCLLEVTGLDLHDTGAHPLKWTHAYDNGYSYNTILALPAGIGLTAAFDGSDETITTTEAGTWALTLALNVPGDATWNATVTAENNLPAAARFPVVAAVSNVLTIPGIFTYPSGATIAPSITTDTAATGDPLTMQSAELLIVRLA